jgi:hypothetical protein
VSILFFFCVAASCRQWCSIRCQQLG